jgi:hypothetical protein
MVNTLLNYLQSLYSKTMEKTKMSLNTIFLKPECYLYPNKIRLRETKDLVCCRRITTLHCCICDKRVIQVEETPGVSLPHFTKNTRYHIESIVNDLKEKNNCDAHIVEALRIYRNLYVLNDKDLVLAKRVLEKCIGKK